MTNIYPLIREAKVVSVKDPEELGRIQLKVYPELSQHPDKDLPWCFPSNAGLDGLDFSMPEEEKIISCIVWNRYWTEITYLPYAVSKPTEHLFKKWMDDQKSKIDDMADDPEEKSFLVQQLSDGFCVFHDKKNSAHGLLHPSGTYFLLDKDGTLFIKGMKEIHIHDKDDKFKFDVDMTSGDTSLETKGKINVKLEGENTLENKGKLTVKSDDALSVEAKGKITVESKDSIEVKSSGDVKVDSTGDVKIDSKGNAHIKGVSGCKVESPGEVTVKAAQCVVDAQIFNFKGTKSQGTVPPSGSGVFCAVPACICSGAPHVG